MPATIEFKAKAHNVTDSAGVLAYVMIDVPELKRSHCDMPEFRKHPRFGGIANSDLFGNALKRIRHDVAPAGFLRMDRLPANVAVDTSGFLVKVTVTV